MISYGFSPSLVLVNVDFAPVAVAAVLTPETVAAFRAFVDAGRTNAGLHIFGPIFAPNNSGGAGAAGDAKTIAVAHPWSDPWWDPMREIIVYGGALALDSPPAYFLHGLGSPHQITAYKVFDEAALLWASAYAIPATLIVSPFFDGLHFAEDTKAMVADLAAARALPTSWVVENYNECGFPFPRECGPSDPAYRAPVGNENDPETVAGVALWLAREAPVGGVGHPPPSSSR